MGYAARVSFFAYGDIPAFPDGVVFECVCDRLGISNGVESLEARQLLWDCLWPDCVNPYSVSVEKPVISSGAVPLCSYKFYKMKGDF